jgi:hypothetical protein
VGTTFQVTGSNWLVAFNVDIVFDPQGSPPSTKSVKPSGDGSFTTTMTVPSRPLRSTPYQVVASQTTPVTPSPSPPPILKTFGLVEATITAAPAFFFVPCPSIRVDPICGVVGDSIHVHGQGFRADLQVSVALTPPTPATPDAIAIPAGDSTFDVVIRVSDRPPGAYSVIAQQLRTQSVARAVFQIPCTKAAIKLVPAVGPPGTVVTVIGTGFPVGSVVKLSWSQGIPVKITSITVGPSQGFQIKLLIFPHDQLGKRKLSAGPDLSVANAIVFNIATADFLVVPGSEQPRDFTWRR